MTIAPHPLAHEPLAFLALEKIRRVGVDRADGQIITHEGIAHNMIAHSISTIETFHVVLEPLQGKAAGHKRALAIVKVREHGYAAGPGGLDLVLPALHSGIRVHGHPDLNHDYFVLPWLAVPPAFQAIEQEHGQ